LTISKRSGGEILWKKRSIVPEKVEDQESPAGRQKIPVTKGLNGEAVGIGGPARTGENPPEFDGTAIP
jgi:hypothetical protein